MSLHELAYNAGIKSRRLQKIEENKCYPTSNELQKIASIFQTDGSILMEDITQDVHLEKKISRTANKKKVGIFTGLFVVYYLFFTAGGAIRMSMAVFYGSPLNAITTRIEKGPANEHYPVYPDELYVVSNPPQAKSSAQKLNKWLVRNFGGFKFSRWQGN